MRGCAAYYTEYKRIGIVTYSVTVIGGSRRRPDKTWKTIKSKKIEVGSGGAHVRAWKGRTWRRIFMGPITAEAVIRNGHLKKKRHLKQWRTFVCLHGRYYGKNISFRINKNTDVPDLFPFEDLPSLRVSGGIW